MYMCKHLTYMCKHLLLSHYEETEEQYHQRRDEVGQR